MQVKIDVFSAEKEILANDSVRLIDQIVEGKYSSNEIESACKRDMNYIWLLNGETAPNYHSIVRFRSERLSVCAEKLFYELVKKLRVMDESGMSISSATAQR